MPVHTEYPFLRRRRLLEPTKVRLRFKLKLALARGTDTNFMEREIVQRISSTECLFV